MKCVYINLDSRPDRRTEAEAEFARVGLIVERFAAISGDNRPLSFNRSVYFCMQLASNGLDIIDGYGNLTYEDLLLFEDDVVFDCDKVEIPELPEGWMSLHLGGNIVGLDTTKWLMPTYYSHNLAVLHNCYQSHATLYSAKCVQYILENMRIDVMDEHNNIFDDWFRRNVLHHGNSYILKPMIAYQRPSFSDIWQCESNYYGAHTYGNKLLARL